MGFYEICSGYKKLEWEDFFGAFSGRDCSSAIDSSDSNADRLAALLSPFSEDHLEDMAQKAQDVTARQFGHTIQLYTPMYLANHCDNECRYCGFNAKNRIERKRLTIKEVEGEAAHIAGTGLKHILILTGESRIESPVSYMRDCVRILKKHFESISIEVYPLTEAEYAELVDEGVDGLTIYQEVYDEGVYKKMHIKGPKQDYRFRLDAPERGARSGMRSINIGVLLGLDDWRREAFMMGIHAAYLQDRYPQIEVGVSLPRLRPEVSGFTAPYTISDKNFVKIITALRIFSPRLGISLSTREAPEFRERLIGLGITRMSAGSTTCVGGHTLGEDSGGRSAQFEILDKRSVEETKRMIRGKGCQPVFKDWMHI